MLTPSLVFVDVDTQRDFMDPDGALAIPGAVDILPGLSRLTDFARKHGVPVLATACAHTLDEPDPEPFPPHCLAGTPGQLRVRETAWLGSRVLGLDQTLPEGELPPHLTLEKRRYDVFSRPDAGAVVARYGRGGPTFVVYGVATDYCVRAAVLGLLACGQRVALVADAVRAVDPIAEPLVLTDLVRRGVQLTVADRVVASAEITSS